MRAQRAWRCNLPSARRARAHARECTRSAQSRARGGVCASAWRTALRKHELPRFLRPRPTGGAGVSARHRGSTGRSAARAVASVGCVAPSEGCESVSADGSAPARAGATTTLHGVGTADDGESSSASATARRRDGGGEGGERGPIILARRRPAVVVRRRPPRCRPHPTCPRPKPRPQIRHPPTRSDARRTCADPRGDARSCLAARRPPTRASLAHARTRNSRTSTRRASS